MKKITSLVAGLVMGIASAFAAASAPCSSANSIVGTIPANDNGFAFNTDIANGGTHRWADVAFEGATESYKFMKIELSGDVASFRFEMDGTACFANAGFNAAGMGNFSDAEANEFWLNLAAVGWNGKSTITMVAGDWGEGSFQIKSITIYDKDPDCSGEATVDPKWISADGKVKLYPTDFKVHGGGENDLLVDGYWYDTMAEEFKDGYPSTNQNFTFAVEVDDDAANLKAFLDQDWEAEDGSKVLPTIAFHMWDFGKETGAEKTEKSSVDCRFDRIGDTYVYAVDINIAAVKDGKNLALECGTANGDKNIPQLWFNAGTACIGDEGALGEAATWYIISCGTLNLNMSLPAAEAQTISFDEDWAKSHTPEGEAGKDNEFWYFTSGIAPVGTATGIEDVIADAVENNAAVKAYVDGQVVVVKANGEVLNVLGAKIK